MLMAMSETKNQKNNGYHPMSDAELAKIRQNSEYSSSGKAAPDNNIFFEEKSNPLSSKGN